MKAEIIDVDERELCSRYHISKLAGKVLAESSLSEEEMDDVLHSSSVLTTSKAACIQKCAARILLAKKRHEKVFVGGDYDADGICATAIMKDTLDRLGIANGYYIPDRFRQGYGLKPETTAAAVKKGYTLILTVDNGVRAQEAIQEAHRLGVEIIVTDHHEIEGDVAADLLVHPDLMEKDYEYLCGAGVALEISRTLLGEIEMHTALAAIASIGDVMPLYKETRKIVKSGIEAIRHHALPAVEGLFRTGSVIDETSIAFQVVPKLNSVGRMHELCNVNTVVPFLLSRDPVQIAHYTMQLNHVNDQRKNLSTQMMQKAETMIDASSSFQLIYSADFHEGICGLVAGRIASEIHEPVVVMAKNNDLIKGSGRGVPGFNLFAFFSEGFEDDLEAFGGHEMAVGLSVRQDHYEHFAQRISEKMSRIEFTPSEEHEYAIHAESSDITIDNIKGLEMLRPYPKNMARPLFAITNPTVTNVFRSPKVTKYTIAAGNGSFEAVQFAGRGLQMPETVHHIAGTLSINCWRNRITPQLSVEDID